MRTATHRHAVSRRSTKPLLVTLAAATALALTAGVAPATATGAPPALVAAPVTASGLKGGPPGEADSYTNPISADFADTFADPAVIRGKDGFWYAFGTTDPLFEGERTRHLLPISRSTDLTTWEYLGDAFTEATLPAWADTTQGASLWAPDIR